MRPAKYRPIYIKSLLAAAEEGPNDVASPLVSDCVEKALCAVAAKVRSECAAKLRERANWPETCHANAADALHDAADALEDDHG